MAELTRMWFWEKFPPKVQDMARDALGGNEEELHRLTQWFLLQGNEWGRKAQREELTGRLRALKDYIEKELRELEEASGKRG